MLNKKIKNSMELNNLLKEKFGDDYSNNDYFASLKGRIEGTINSKKISITFKAGEYLLLSTSPGTEDVIDQLTPLLNEVMNINNPICQYNLQSEGINRENAMPTIEWDILNPEERIQEIINGEAFSDDSIIHDLKLFGDRKKTDYLKTKEEQQTIIANARIFGIDSGSIKNPTEFSKMGEIELYFNIDAIGGHIWRCRHEMSHGRIQKIDLTEEQYAMEFMVYQTTRFGVELPSPEVGMHVIPSDSYWNWFRFYDNHFKNVLSNDEWKNFQNAQKNGEDISAFLPDGTWNSSLEGFTKKK